jgi:riboflavin synthase
MFTGIVEELGHVRAWHRHADGARLEVACTTVLSDATVGASIAVNGCCLTVTDLDDGAWTADVQPESLERTTLGGLVAGDPVNLERPVRLTDRLGGHLVQGHVDAVGTVAARTPEPDGSTRLVVSAPPALRRYVVEKGSVTLDGFGVALIPHTLAVTTLGVRQPGDHVNVEADVVAKYVERLLSPQP